MRWQLSHHSNKPYIVPSYYGITYFLLVMNIFAMSYYRESGSFHTVGLTLIVLGLVAMIHSNSNIALTSTELRGEVHVEEGAQTQIALTIRNLGPDCRYKIVIELDDFFKNTASAFLVEVDKEKMAHVKITINERGIYTLKRIKISSYGLYGLFYVWKWIPCEYKVIVYPRPIGYTSLPIHSSTVNTGTDEEEFQGHKPYQSGQSLRRVDWKAYARIDRFLIKDFSVQKSEPVELDFNTSPGKNANQKLQQLCAWIFLAIKEGRPYSLSMPHGVLDLGNGIEHLQEALYLLASYKEEIS